MAHALSSPAAGLRGAIGLLVVALCGCIDPKPSSQPRPELPQTQQAGAKPEAEPEPEANYRVVITIDDLPLAMRDAYRDDDERRATVRKLVDGLNRRGVPFVGFFNMAHHDKDPTLTQTWLEAQKMTVGNHTWSHPNARRTETAAFLSDLTRGHDAVVALRPEQKMIPFRFPYLNQGWEPERREAIFAKLEELGSRHAPVTIDTSDWLFATGYLDALHAEDKAEAERWRQAWLWNIEETTIRAENQAELLFGRFPPQVLLLHGNRLLADHLDDALDWYEARGYEFVTLDAALADAAYSEPDESHSPIGESHWLRLRRTRAMEEGGSEP